MQCIYLKTSIHFTCCGTLNHSEAPKQLVEQQFKSWGDYNDSINNEYDLDGDSIKSLHLSKYDNIKL